jgi:hypothetical protein
MTPDPTTADQDGLRAVRDLEDRIRHRLRDLDTTGELVARARQDADALLVRIRHEAEQEARRVRAASEAAARRAADRQRTDWAARTAVLEGVAAQSRNRDVADIAALCLGEPSGSEAAAGPASGEGVGPGRT